MKQHKERKPPMSVEELEKKTGVGDDGPKQGPLSFMDKRTRRRRKPEADAGNGGGGRGGFNFVQVLLPAVVAVALAAVMVVMFAPSKGSVSDMQATVNALQVSVSETNSDISSLYGQISSLNTDIGKLATSTDIANLRADISDLEDDLDGFNDQSAAITAILARLAVLEADGGDGGTSGDGDVTVSLMSEQSVIYDGDVYLFEIKVENSRGSAITPQVVIEFQNDTGSDLLGTTFARTGGFLTTFDVTFSPSGTGCTLIYCRSDEVMIPAGETVVVLAELNLNYKVGGDKAIWNWVSYLEE